MVFVDCSSGPHVVGEPGLCAIAFLGGFTGSVNRAAGDTCVALRLSELFQLRLAPALVAIAIGSGNSFSAFYSDPGAAYWQVAPGFDSLAKERAQPGLHAAFQP